MATIKLIIKATEKRKPATVYLRFVNGRETDIIAKIPVKVYPEYWSNKTESYKQRIVFDAVFTHNEKIKIENDLNELKTHVLNQYNELVKTGTKPSKDWLEIVIDKHYHQGNKNETLNQYIERFISEIETGQRLYEHKGQTKRYEMTSVKTFKYFKNIFSKYQDVKKINLNFHNITMDFYDKFVGYFTQNNYKANTIGKYIKILKTLMRSARDEGLHNNQEIERKKFKVIRVEVQNIYLNENEIKKISLLYLKDKPHLEIARDVFLIGCYTAQRFSDYSRIRKDNLKTLQKGARIIDIIQQKTGEKCLIPIKPELDTLLKKYEYQVPKVFVQKVNQNIKIVAKLAGIMEPIEIEEIKGGLKIKTTVPKHDLITTHTARRSGATNMYKAGISTLDIMKITGHKSQKEFLNYIRIGKEEVAEMLSNHKYFKEKLRII